MTASTSAGPPDLAAADARPNAQACAIDFGTSNSTVGLATGAGSRLIALEGGHVTLPSAVFWDSDGAPPLFGRAAIAAYVDGEDGRLMRGLKSTLGSSLLADRTRVGNRSLTFREILAAYIGHLKARADAAAGAVLTRVVLGRPVHFVDDDPEADRAAQTALEEIARARGFSDIAFEYEPIAAALDYEQTVQAEELVLIVDIGGGTSDVSVVRVSPQGALRLDRMGDILGNDGIRLGGTDFDRLLSLAEVMPLLGFGSTTGGGRAVMPRHYYLALATWHRINQIYTPQVATDLKALRHDADHPERLDRLMRVVTQRAGHSLAMAVEAGKITLSGAEVARLDLHALTGGPNPLIRRAGFDAVMAPALLRLRDLIDRVLMQAGLRDGERIKTVFLTGGSSFLPAVRDLVQARLPEARLAHGDMFGSVGAGLARSAALRFG